MAWYNEIDPFAAQWLRNLAQDGHIAPGEVCERSISDLEPRDIPEGQCHFFAGIGGWSYALRLAGVTDDAPIWTGSCPCQPFSAAGRGRKHEDERHLWPAWFRLIRERRPDIVFGEQVASNAGFSWLDAVRADLEAEGYAVGAADLCAAGVGAPHIRQRIYFVANSGSQRRDRLQIRLLEREPQQAGPETTGSSGPSLVAHTHDSGRRAGHGETSGGGGEVGIRPSPDPGNGSETGVVGHPDNQGPQGRNERWDGADECPAGTPSLAGFWGDAQWIPCRDGKARPAHPESFPLSLADGIPGRVGRLRAYGNAIVPQVAAAFIQAFLGQEASK